MSQPITTALTENDRFQAVLGDARGLGESLLADERPGQLARQELKALTRSLDRGYERAWLALCANVPEHADAPLIAELRQTLSRHLANSAQRKLRAALHSLADAFNLAERHPGVLIIDGVAHLWPRGWEYASFEQALYERGRDFVLLACGREVAADQFDRAAKPGEWKAGVLPHCPACARRGESSSGSAQVPPRDPPLTARQRETLKAERENACAKLVEECQSDPCAHERLAEKARVKVAHAYAETLTDWLVERDTARTRERLICGLGVERYMEITAQLAEHSVDSPGLRFGLAVSDWQQFLVSELLGLDPGKVGGRMRDRLVDRVERRLTRRRVHER